MLIPIYFCKGKLSLKIKMITSGINSI